MKKFSSRFRIKCRFSRNCYRRRGNVQATVTDSASTDIGIGFSGHGPGTTPGPLDIQWAPIGLDFSNSNMVNTTAVQAFPETTGTNKYVVVSEKRSNEPTREWSLTAQFIRLDECGRVRNTYWGWTKV